MMNNPIISVENLSKRYILGHQRSGDGLRHAVESVVPKSDINVLIPALKDHGATGILELPISKIVH